MTSAPKSRPLRASRRSAAGEKQLAISTTALTKRFGSIVAVDAVDLRVPTAAVSGFVGPNGAGKTTTIRMLLGLIRPSAGSGTVLGAPLTAPAAYLDRVGALIEGPAFYPALSGRANLVALARLGGIDAGSIAGLLERVGLSGRADDPYRAYSLGMKQRLGIAAALLARPRLLVLDEPANGLDPAGIVEVRRLLRSLAEEGMSVFVSSHLLAEVEQICDHLVMIRDGRLVFQGPVAELVAAQGVELAARPERRGDARKLVALCKRAGYHARVEDGTVFVATEADWAGELNRLAMAAGITLVHLSEHRPSLEAAFFELAGAATGDVGPARNRESGR